MFFEVAVHPEVAARWGRRDLFRNPARELGMDARRILAKYPRGTWVREVRSAFAGLSAADRGDPKRFEAMLSAVAMGVVSDTRPKRLPSEDTPWTEAVLQLHQLGVAHRFRAIVVPRLAGGADEVITTAEAAESGEAPCWNIEPVEVVARSAAELVDALAPLLRCSRHIRLVDPYFDIAKRTFREPFETMLAVLEERGVWRSLELHAACENAGGGRTAAFAQQSLEQGLSRRLPVGREMTVFLWQEQDRGEKLHNRYVLTEVGGVAFGTGLDQGQGGQTDDLHPLSSRQHERRWRQYRRDGADFHLASSFVVRSTK